MKTEILKKLEEYHKFQGISFLSEKDAANYFSGLVTIVQMYYQTGRCDALKEGLEIIKTK